MFQILKKKKKAIFMGKTHLFNKRVGSFPKEVTSVVYRVLFVGLFVF